MKLILLIRTFFNNTMIKLKYVFFTVSFAGYKVYYLLHYITQVW